MEARVRIEEKLQNELEAVKVSIVLINPIFGIMRHCNLSRRQYNINENC